MGEVLTLFDGSHVSDEAPETHSRTANILLVDDSHENLVALEAILRPLKQNLVLARSGEEALKCLLKQDFAVILLDVKMPGMDGFETAAYVKQLERTRHIPIIFLTALSTDREQMSRGYSSGAVDYVVKPFDPVILKAKVGAFVELYEKTLALHDSEERFRRAFASAPIGVAVVDLDGKFRMVNRALCEMTAYEGPQLLSMRFSELCDSDTPGLDLKQIAEAYTEDKRAYHDERVLRAASGEDVHVLVSVAFVPGVRDSAPYLIVQMTDITDRKKLESFRQRFVANAAHELRTPTSIILGTTNILADNRTSLSEDEVDECLDVLERQGARLSGMITTLLDMARLEEGRMDVSPREVSLHELASEVLSGIRPPEEVEVDLSITRGLKAWADPSALDRILMNLLTNAYNYGGSHIKIAARRKGENVVITVKDDGDGVPVDLVPRLFDPFARGATASRVGGSGLGLSLVRGLAQAMGGDVSYSPEKPHGAAFAITLPREKIGA